MTARLDFIRLAALLTLTISCQSSAPPPATIDYGKDACAKCEQKITDRRFAAQYALGSEVKKFDDPGCLFRSLRDETATPSGIYFQHFLADRWLPQHDAWFANPPQVATPRGYGWSTYASFGEAQDAVTSGGGGQILQYEQASQRIALGNQPPAAADR